MKDLDREPRVVTREFLRLTRYSLRDLAFASRCRYYEVCRVLYGSGPIPLYPFLRLVQGLKYLSGLVPK